MNSKAGNILLCALSKEEYTKVHIFRSAKQMWNTLAITYERSNQAKCNKLDLLTHKYEMLKIEENEDIQDILDIFKPY